MSDFFQDVERFRRPELILGELIRKYARGEVVEQGHAPKTIHRAVVLAVDEEGGRLSADGPAGRVPGVGLDGSTREYASVLGPSNPRNSVKALVIDEGRDSFGSEEDARVLWPFFPPDQISMPVSPGEHVYVIFEDRNFSHGLWLFRVPGQDSANFMLGSEFYLAQPGRRDLNASFDGRTSQVQQVSSDEFTSRMSSRRDLNSLF